MRIDCPNCAAEYEVPEAALAAGPRLLRCTRCGHGFEAAAPRPEPPAAPPPEPDPAPLPTTAPKPARAGVSALRPERAAPRDPPAPLPPQRVETPARERLVDPPPQPPRGPLMLAWLVSLAVLATIGWALWRFRAEVVEAWAPMARLYRAFGLD